MNLMIVSLVGLLDNLRNWFTDLDGRAVRRRPRVLPTGIDEQAVHDPK